MHTCQLRIDARYEQLRPLHPSRCELFVTLGTCRGWVGAVMLLRCGVLCMLSCFLALLRQLLRAVHVGRWSGTLPRHAGAGRPIRLFCFHGRWTLTPDEREQPAVVAAVSGGVGGFAYAAGGSWAAVIGVGGGGYWGGRRLLVPTHRVSAPSPGPPPPLSTARRMRTCYCTPLTMLSAQRDARRRRSNKVFIVLQL